VILSEFYNVKEIKPFLMASLLWTLFQSSLFPFRLSSPSSYLSLLTFSQHHHLQNSINCHHQKEVRVTEYTHNHITLQPCLIFRIATQSPRGMTDKSFQVIIQCANKITVEKSKQGIAESIINSKMLQESCAIAKMTARI